jgi:hypothetical protein
VVLVHPGGTPFRHSCTLGAGPHSIKVLVPRVGNDEAVFARLRAVALPVGAPGHRPVPRRGERAVLVAAGEES